MTRRISVPFAKAEGFGGFMASLNGVDPAEIAAFVDPGMNPQKGRGRKRHQDMLRHKH